jgi:hypothetical protein
MKKFTKAFGVYHWDTFDNETILIGECDTLQEAQQLIHDKYKGRLSAYGADKVDIVDQLGNVIEQYSTC